MQIQEEERQPYAVLIIKEQEEIISNKKGLNQEAIMLICNVLKTHRTIVIVISQLRLYFISEVQVASKQNGLTYKNGVKFKKTFGDIIANSIHLQLKQYLRRLSQNDLNWTDEEKIDFVKRSYEFKSYKNPLEYKFKCNHSLYDDQQNQIIYIDSPVANIMPQIMELEQSVPFQDEKYISTNPNVYIRVMREIHDVNDDFFSLRTIISPSTNGMLNLFNFVMFPNDGAFCSLPLIGRIIIPQTYPTNPPVFHLFTRTNRYNLDVFNGYAKNNSFNQSSICFDIVKPINNLQSTWKPQYTISTIFASIMDAIVSYKVPQMYGGQKQEFVTMQSLKSSYSNVKSQISQRFKDLNKLPSIPVIKSIKIMCNMIQFPQFKDQTYIFSKGQESLISNPWVLQQNIYKTIEFQLKNLRQEFVLSFILTNNPKDIKGNSNNTILFRNGVTATAAKKIENKPLTWFYHGKPLNSGDMKVNLTITPNQFAISYVDQSTNGNWVLHGDTPLTSLKKNIVNDLSKHEFSLVVYVKNKHPKLGNKFIMNKVMTNIGYIHSKSQFN